MEKQGTNSGINPEIIKQYKDSDKFFLINHGDKNLIPIRIPLPDTPLLNEIDGFGLPAEEQIFQKQKYPSKLKKLEKECKGQIEDIWVALNKNQNIYHDEINWIKTQWYYRLYGYWFFNNGKPTYIDGCHFYYLNNFNIDIGLPFYFDRDRRWFIAQKYFEETTFDFINKDKEGNAIPNENGEYEMYDTGRYLFSGVINRKGRRRGDTYKNGCIGLEKITRTIDADQTYGIQANDGEGAYVAYTKAKHAWKKLAWYFMPEYDNASNPEGGIYFNTVSKRGANTNIINSETGLESKIIYATTADRNFFDKHKLLFFTEDESGKCFLEDVIARWQVIRKCLYVGANRVGFSCFTTTSGQMNKGGERFKQLCQQSNFYCRNENGETTSGLVDIFWNAADAYEGYIDRYGMSVIDDPTEEQKRELKIKMGSKQFLLNDRNLLLQKGDSDSLKVYREKKRLDPLESSDCFLTDTGDVGMPYEKIDARLAELALEKSNTRLVNYKEYEPNNPNGIVIQEDDPNGRWEISYDLPPERANKGYIQNDIWFPFMPAFIASADPFRSEKAKLQQKQKASDGGGCVFWDRDYEIDPLDKDIHEWTTNRNVCTYLYRPETTDEFCEDMLLMCRYWGALMYPEHNLDYIEPYFMKRGYGGYLLRGFDRATGKLKSRSGFSALGGSQQLLLNCMIAYMEKHCHRERHIPLLKQCRDIKGVEDFTNNDLFVAAGGCQLAIQNRYHYMPQKKEKQDNTEEIFDEFHY